MHRIRLSALVGALALLAACNGEEVAEPPSCQETDCAEEVAAFVEEVEALEQVGSVEDVSYAFDDRFLSGANIPTVVMQIRLTTTEADDCEALEATVGRLLWESRVAPVGGWAGTCLARGEQGPGQNVTYSFAAEQTRELLVEEWGQRPTGAES